MSVKYLIMFQNTHSIAEKPFGIVQVMIQVSSSGLQQFAQGTYSVTFTSTPVCTLALTWIANMKERLINIISSLISDFIYKNYKKVESSRRNVYDAKSITVAITVFMIIFFAFFALSSSQFDVI